MIEVTNQTQTQNFVMAISRFNPVYDEYKNTITFRIPSMEIKSIDYINGGMLIKLKDTSEFRIFAYNVEYVYPVKVEGSIQPDYESAELRLNKRVSVKFHANYIDVEIITE